MQIPSDDDVARSTEAGDAPRSSTSLTRSEMLVAAAALAAGTLATFGFLLTRGSTAAEASATTAPLSGPVPRVAPARVADTVAWTDVNRESWLGNRTGVAYEVEAAASVGAWMRTVRPSLVVRCAGAGTEVFVFTDSPARLERGTPDHSVRYSFDGRQEETGLWPDSDAHDALFAPDAAAFAARIANARTLRFGFTPHNASPVEVDFQVAGLAPLLDAAGKRCAPPGARKAAR